MKHLRWIAIALAAGCHGKGAGTNTKPEAPDEPTEPETPTPAAGGGSTSGFPDVNWGDSMDQVRVAYPDAESGQDDGDEGFERLELETSIGGREAFVEVVFTEGGASYISLFFDVDYESMDECGADFASVRAELDRAFGASQEDNLDAIWNTATATVDLECDPSRVGRAGGTIFLEIVYEQPE